MDLRRLRAGEVLLSVAGAALLAALFLPWYGSESTGGTLTGWEAFSVLDLVLVLAAAAALSVGVVTASQRVPAVPIALDALVKLVGLVALVLVALRAVFLPDGAEGREAGLWIALAGAAGIVVSGAVAMRDERLSPPERPTDVTGRPIPDRPVLEPRPAPPRSGPS
jgi:hypothetical protein